MQKVEWRQLLEFVAFTSHSGVCNIAVLSKLLGLQKFHSKHQISQPQSMSVFCFTFIQFLCLITLIKINVLFHPQWFIFPLVSCPSVYMLVHPSSYGHFLTIVWKLFKRCIGYDIQPSYFLQWWWGYSVQVFQSHFYTVHVLCIFLTCLIR